MTKKKSTKRALISSLLVLAMCFTMLAGTTFAWFTDSVESGANIIKAGKLSIDLAIKADGDQDYVSVKANPTKVAFPETILWEPGYTAWANAKVTTDGTLALKYTMKIAAEGAVSALADVIDVYYAASEKNIDKTDRAASLAQLTKIGTLRQAIDGTIVINDTLIPGTNEADFATIALHMQETAGNEYQELSIGSGFKFVILATQYTYEEDAFDNQYDKDAEFPTYESVATPDAFVAALADTDVDVVVLDGDITLDDAVVIPAGTSKTIDLGDNKTLDIGDDYLDVYGHLELAGEGTVKAQLGSATASAIYLNPVNGNDSNTNSLTIGKDVTLEADGYGVTVWYDGGSSEGPVINVAGKIDTASPALCITGNATKVSDDAAIINIYDGAVIESDDVAIYAAGYGEWNIYGGTITGTTGIEIRAGKLNVYGGTIRGTATPVTVNPNGNGTTTDGAGIAVAQHTTKLPIEVNISGGTIEGYTALYESNPQGNSDADLAKITIKVTGGTFNAINGGSNKFGIADAAKITYVNTVA